MAIVGQLYGVPPGILESLPLFYTKMSFKILKFFNRTSVFFPSILYLKNPSRFELFALNSPHCTVHWPRRMTDVVGCDREAAAAAAAVLRGPHREGEGGVFITGGQRFTRSFAALGEKLTFSHANHRWSHF
jgi:hypothetical protein